MQSPNTIPDPIPEAPAGFIEQATALNKFYIALINEALKGYTDPNNPTHLAALHGAAIDILCSTLIHMGTLPEEWVNDFQIYLGNMTSRYFARTSGDEFNAS